MGLGDRWQEVGGWQECKLIEAPSVQNSRLNTLRPFLGSSSSKVPRSASVIIP